MVVASRRASPPITAWAPEPPELPEPEGEESFIGISRSFTVVFVSKVKLILWCAWIST